MMTFIYWLPFAVLLKKVFSAALTAAEDTFEAEFQFFDCWSDVLDCIHIEIFCFLFILGRNGRSSQWLESNHLCKPYRKLERDGVRRYHKAMKTNKVPDILGYLLFHSRCEHLRPERILDEQSSYMNLNH